MIALVVAALSSGCLTTIDDACTSASETHCAACFTCADEVDGLSGAELCDVPADEGESLSDCEAFLGDRCESEARTREEPYDELDECEIAVEEETCQDLVDREVHDQPAAPDECRRYL